MLGEASFILSIELKNRKVSKGYKVSPQSSSFFFAASLGGSPKTKKAEYNKKAKATDMTEYMIQSSSTRLYRLRFNQSKMESSSSKSSIKIKIKIEFRQTK